jgi:hypothetical protein
MTRGSARPRRAAAAVVAMVLVLGAGTRPAHAQADPERVRTAKTLFFDRKYAEARLAWEAVRKSATAAEAQTASYWVARCSESLGENERAFREYGAFLATRPRDPALAEEARTSRVGLAARLFPSGRPEYGQVLREALADPSKTVRYYAALRMPPLGKDMGALAAPVLRQILAQEKDPDLVDRAKLALLRVDPSALEPEKRPSAAPGKGPAEARWVHVRITEKGVSHPKVSINLPLGLAEMVFKSLPDDVKSDLRAKGYEADTFWDGLRKLGPSEIITIDDEDGQHIQIWTE